MNKLSFTNCAFSIFLAKTLESLERTNLHTTNGVTGQSKFQWKYDHVVQGTVIITVFSTLLKLQETYFVEWSKFFQIIKTLLRLSLNLLLSTAPRIIALFNNHLLSLYILMTLLHVNITYWDNIVIRLNLK